jgi:hypothetical protein
MEDEVKTPPGADDASGVLVNRDFVTDSQWCYNPPTRRETRIAEG